MGSRIQEDARKLIDDLNSTLRPSEQWQVLVYASQFITTPDSAKVYGRFLVVVPGRDYDRWIQFGIRTPVDAEGGQFASSAASVPALREGPVNNVSIVAVSKRARPGEPRPVASVDWWRVFVDGPTARIQQTRREFRGETGNCQQCHQTGLIGIHPRELYRIDDTAGLVMVPMGSVDKPLPPGPEAPELKTLEALSLLWRTYGAPLPVSRSDSRVGMAEAYGPPLGAIKQRTVASVRAACPAASSAATVSDQDILAIIPSMNCSSCHSSSGHGVMNHPLATDLSKEPDSLLYQYIAQGLMPPPHPGSTPRPAVPLPLRGLLHACLVSEYFEPTTGTGSLVDWLKNDGPDQDAALAGAQLFKDQCSRCHESAGDSGPSLKNVFGRVVAGDDEFIGYSDGLTTLKNQHVQWDENSLREFIYNPNQFLSERTRGIHVKSEMRFQMLDMVNARQLAEFLKTH